MRKQRNNYNNGSPAMTPTNNRYGTDYSNNWCDTNCIIIQPNAQTKLIPYPPSRTVCKIGHNSARIHHTRYKLCIYALYALARRQCAYVGLVFNISPCLILYEISQKKKAPPSLNLTTTTVSFCVVRFDAIIRMVRAEK